MLNAFDALQILSHFMTGAFLSHLKDEETESWRRNWPSHTGRKWWSQVYDPSQFDTKAHSLNHLITGEWLILCGHGYFLCFFLKTCQ